MLFEKAIAPLTEIFHKEGMGYVGEEWVKAGLENYFEGTKSAPKVNDIFHKFVTGNSVEAPTSEILRLGIMQYTFGYFVRDILYKNRFRNNPKDRGVYTAHSKLSFANALIQWKIMAEQLDFDWDEMLALGQEHLEERYKDFNKDGWCKL